METQMVRNGLRAVSLPLETARSGAGVMEAGDREAGEMQSWLI